MTKHISKIEKLIAQLCPKGVRLASLGEICLSITAGGDLPEDYLKGQNIPSMEFPYPIFSNGKADKALYGYADSYRIDSEAVTISARGTIGYHTVHGTKFTPIVRLITRIPNTEIITCKFLNYALDITGIGHSGGSIPQLIAPNVKKIKIPVPPHTVQEEIVKILNSFTEQEARKKQYEHYRSKFLNIKEYE
jgi:type I restriction enzyme, S subunit